MSSMYQTGGDESLEAYVSRLWWCSPLQDNVPFSSTDTGEFTVNEAQDTGFAFFNARVSREENPTSSVPRLTPSATSTRSKPLG